MKLTEQKRPVSLEVAHLHAPERLVSLNVSGAKGVRCWSDVECAQSLNKCSLLELQVGQREGTSVDEITRLALHDDVIARDRQRGSADSWRWALFNGVSAESIVVGTEAEVHSESSFVRRGKELQMLICERADRLGIGSEADGKLHIRTTDGIVKVKIFGFNGIPDPAYPGCAVLDLAWTEWRIKNFARTFTALPQSYQKQQRQLSALAALVDLPGRDTVTTLFLNSGGEIVRESNLADLKVV